MKPIHAFFAGVFLVSMTSAFTLNYFSVDTRSINGAWKLKGKNGTAIISDGYFSQTTYDKSAKTFDETYGGTMTMDGNTLKGKIQFSSKNKEMFGQSFNMSAELKGNTLTITQQDGSKQEWERLEGGSKNLAGLWRVADVIFRDEQGCLPLKAERPIRILSDGHFQYIATNIETGKFSMTKGGTYTFKNGRYKENIEFSSPDQSRVGTNLTFYDWLKDNIWHHNEKTLNGESLSILLERSNFSQ